VAKFAINKKYQNYFYRLVLQLYMGRKGLTVDQKNQLILLTATGSNNKSIAEQIDVTTQTVRNYQKKYSELIEAKRKELAGEEPPKETKPKGGYKPPPKDTETDKPEPPKEKRDPIEVKAEPDFIKKGATVASEELKEMYTQIIKDGKSIMNARYKFQSSVEQMGVDWNKFLNFAIEIGYEEIEKEYMRELERFRDEQAIALELEEQLHQQEVSEIENGQINFDDILRMESEQENE
jgi:hypothetical protein